MRTHQQEEAWEPDPPEILPALSDYLRYTHFYCMWCGAQYADSVDLKQSCPGDTLELHEDSTLADDLDFAD